MYIWYVLTQKPLLATERGLVFRFEASVAVGATKMIEYMKNPVGS